MTDTYQIISRTGLLWASVMVQRQSDGAFIPMAQENTDCIQFLADWANGATVTNADSSPAPYSTAAVTALGLTP